MPCLPIPTAAASGRRAHAPSQHQIPSALLPLLLSCQGLSGAGLGTEHPHSPFWSWAPVPAFLGTAGAEPGRARCCTWLVLSPPQMGPCLPAPIPCPPGLMCSCCRSGLGGSPSRPLLVCRGWGGAPLWAGMAPSSAAAEPGLLAWRSHGPRMSSVWEGHLHPLV